MSRKKEKTVKVNNHHLVLTNLAKLHWPKDKITKGAMINYYEKMTPFILPYLKARSLSLKRH